MSRVSVNEIVTSKISNSSSVLQIGPFNWPNTAPIPGSTLKTDGMGNLTFEEPNVRSSIDASSASYAIGPSDDIVAITGTLDTNLTLPDPTTKTIGDMIYIVKEVDGASIITVLPFGSELISGGTSTTLDTPYGSLRIYTNGTNWFALF
ncbi:unnamed protein product [Ectocarpus sp. 6 AP-2014]